MGYRRRYARVISRAIVFRSSEVEASMKIEKIFTVSSTEHDILVMEKPSMARQFSQRHGWNAFVRIPDAQIQETISQEQSKSKVGSQRILSYNKEMRLIKLA